MLYHKTLRYFAAYENDLSGLVAACEQPEGISTKHLNPGHAEYYHHA